MIKKAFIILLCCIFTTMSFSTVAAAVEPDMSQSDIDGYKLAAQNDEIALYYKEDKASVAVKQISNGKMWYSELPTEKYPTEGVNQLITQEFQSLLQISYTLINKTTSTKSTAPLEALKPVISTSAIANGLCYTIFIEDLNLQFDVDIVLDGNKLEFYIPDEKINEGKGADKLITGKVDQIIKFVDSTLETIEEIEGNSDYPSSFKSYLKKSKKQLEQLREIVEDIESPVRIEEVSDDLLEILNDLQGSLIGSGSSAGFFNKIATSDKVDDDAKKDYNKIQYNMSNQFTVIKVAVSAMKSINVGSLVEVEVMPYFGAQIDTDTGYMLYPNGSGAINEFKEKHSDYSSNFKAAAYSDTSPDIDWEVSIDSAGLKRTYIPYFGIKSENSAVLGYVCSGQSESSIIFSPSGYVVDVNRTYASFEYRRTVAVASTGGQWQAGQTPTAYEEQRNPVDAKVCYFFLRDENADYSGMAAALRGYLAQNGKLNKSSIISGGVPLAIDILGGYNQKVLIFNNFVSATRFNQAQNMIDKLLRENNIPLLVNYRGATSSGYGVYPTERKLASDLGGETDFKNLSQFVESKGGTLFLEDNIIEAQISENGYSEGDLSLGSNYRVVQSSDKSTYILSPTVVAERLDDFGIGFYKSTSAGGVTLDRIGSFLYYDYSDRHGSTRSETFDIWSGVLKSVKEQVGAVAVNGANEYVLPYADWIKNVATTSTGYLHTDYDVPFYQMLIHGYIPYTSEAVNQFYDNDYQFLKMLEYGNIPYFTVSEAAIDTNEAGTYATQFEVCYESIVDTYNRYSQCFAELVDKHIVSHRIDGDLVIVEYSNGAKLYINYSDDNITADGFTVEAMNYYLTGAKGGVTIEKTEYTSDKSGEQGGLHIYNTLDYRIFIILLVSVGLLVGIGVFLYHKFRHI